MVYAGSLEILQWFEQHDKPAFALHGRRNNVNLPGIGVLRLPVISDLVSRLVSMGHCRIVMLSREERRKPNLGLLERYFMGELESHGIKTGPYNIPDWSDSPAGLKKLVQTLFRYTPPTALLVDDASLFHAVQINLARRGITAPDHISLFCNDYEQSFAWALPEIAHIRWDHLPSIRRILKWAMAVADGKTDRRKSDIKATQHGAGTLGPARKNR